MRIFKRLREAERNIDKIFGRLASITKNIVNLLRDVKRIKEDIAGLQKENIELRRQLKEICDKLPEYEDAVAKGVERKWDDAVQTVVNFNPYVELNKPEVNK